MTITVRARRRVSAMVLAVDASNGTTYLRTEYWHQGRLRRVFSALPTRVSDRAGADDGNLPLAYHAMPVAVRKALRPDFRPPNREGD
jgi:hypothetical protein